MEDLHQRITQVQLDLWLTDPVTLNYLKCLGFARRKIEAQLAIGTYIERDNNDLSMNNTHNAMGTVEGLRLASNPKGLIEQCSMVEDKKDDNDN